MVPTFLLCHQNCARYSDWRTSLQNANFVYKGRNRDYSRKLKFAVKCVNIDGFGEFFFSKSSTRLAEKDGMVFYKIKSREAVKSREIAKSRENV